MQLRRRENDFKSVLKNANPPIQSSDTWEAVSYVHVTSLFALVYTGTLGGSYLCDRMATNDLFI